MLAEIMLLRLEAAPWAAQDATPFTHSRFVPICRGLVFKRSGTPDRHRLRFTSIALTHCLSSVSTTVRPVRTATQTRRRRLPPWP